MAWDTDKMKEDAAGLLGKAGPCGVGVQGLIGLVGSSGNG